MRGSDRTGSGLPAGALSPAERQATVHRLCAHFARDAMTDTELERRLDLAYAARTRAELISLERDLPALETEGHPAGPPSPASASVAVDPTRTVQDSDLIVSVWGATERKGSWIPPRQLTSISVMGGAELDFREAVFATRETSLRLLTVMGGVEILIPPGVRVEWRGVALMGGVTTPEPSAPPTPDAPVIRISGLVLMGGVEIVERLPGESAREARKRIRRARKARHRLGLGT
ncbi:DUF1707 SHOCT-like domain-containing protein [Candidatus Palauibacter sp.]|uniref:DUF1707 SHOCT-like domain-containing protein n=1 Tax=Candidatus Palauibacter sp. TaxID=3101350 RepID=UPI003B5BD56F